MANGLKEIRKKISSVNNTKKTTRAMKLVSTSKLKKAEEMARRARVFADKLNEVFYDMMLRIKRSGLTNIDSKFFNNTDSHDVKVVDIVFVTADKGLCGGFNSITMKEVLRLKDEYEKKKIQVRFRCIGKKGYAFFAFNNIPLEDSVADLSASPDYEKSSNFIGAVVDDFLVGKTDEVIIVHNGFKNLISQELKSVKILPLIPSQDTLEHNNGMSSVLNISPEDEENVILDELAKKYVEYNMYYALVDSLAAEHSARMQAMDAATNNATELVKALTISYNKARQEAITTELVEINAGVEAMK
ncbi:ATP synthase F1 subunit gamma [Helicobacter trogontum]|uniref:ATP synthase gamma chain n=1 Tax=Helicobacter trogontum TaxID=50960 RepID=A0A4U8T9E4_9HELI|nr:ATP synthase F1 subunit gamma [Helicobacter trogontum]MDY5185093.1 ATP synthase F1 subunit gamma [Helicobacter trogontum]TLD96401.1 F0F1 ATP synthase subunit gamma [Helicobacter trogontum]